MEIWQCSAQFTFLPDWPLLDPFARTDFPFCLFRLSPESLPRSLSQLNGCNNSESNEPRGRSILGNETHSRFLAEIRSRGVGRFLACTITSHPDYEMTLVKEREKECAGEIARKGILLLFLFLFFTHTYARTHVRSHARATDRARASKSNASASDTPGSRSFLRSSSHTTFPARAPCLSPPSPLLSLSVHLVVSLSLSFPLHWSVHSRSPSFVLFLTASLFPSWFLMLGFSILVVSSLGYYIDEMRLSSFNVLSDDLLVPVFLKCWPSLLSHPRLPIDACSSSV